MDAVLFVGGDEPLGLERPRENGGAEVERHVEERGETVDVAKRQYGLAHRAAGNGHLGAKLDGVGHQVAVGEYNHLGGACRAGGDGVAAWPVKVDGDGADLDPLGAGA